MNSQVYEESSAVSVCAPKPAAAATLPIHHLVAHGANLHAVGELHIPYPNRVGPRDYHGRANRIVDLPGGIRVSLAPVWHGSYETCPMHPTGPVYFIPRRPIPPPSDQFVLPILGDMTMQVRPRRFCQAVKMLHRLADLPLAVIPKRPEASAFARVCFPDQTTRALSAAAWGQVRQQESAWVQTTYGPALELYEARRSAIWTAINQDL